MKIPRPLYSVLLYAAAPLAMLYLKKRAARQPDYLKHWAERFGTARYPSPKGGRLRILIHAVSVGETRATFSLAEAILKKWPQVDLLYTHMTPTGREVSSELIKKFGSRVEHCYLPYDTPFAIQRFLEKTRPDMCLLAETEVWPNLTYFAKKKGIPLILVNGRLSEKSLQKSLKVGSLITDAMGRLDLALAQSEEDAGRLRRCGCKDICVTGNLKFDYVPNELQVRTGKELSRIKERKVLCLASSRDGEEKAFLEALSEALAAENLSSSEFFEKVLVLIVPRHPQRFAQVKELAEKSGFKTGTRCAVKDWRQALRKEGVEVLVGNTMGEMALYYALSDVALMGGSFGSYGSQSIIEPCAVGCALIVGPSVFNFAQSVCRGAEAGALVRVESFKEGVQEALRLLNSPQHRQKLADDAERYAASEQGATERTIEKICQFLKVKPDV